MIMFSLIFAIGIAFIYSKTVLWASDEKESTLTIHPSETKNEASWGNELRFYYIMLNGEAIDFNKMERPKGWSFDGTFLFYSGQGDDLVFHFNQRITEIKIRVCKQNGSGMADVLVNGREINRIDLYDKEWVQVDYIDQLVTKINLIAFAVGAWVFTFFLLYNIYRYYYNSKQIAKTNNSLGMFDLAKGIGMILVLLFHSMGLFDSTQGRMLTGYATSLPHAFLSNGLMPAFFIVNGYSFKKKEIKKNFVSMSKLLLLPYLYVAGIVSIISLSKSVVNGTSVKDCLLQYTLPFLTDATRIGPMWFLLALYFGTLIFNIIMQHKNKLVHLGFVFVIYIIGIIVLDFKWIPYAFSVSFTAVGYIYLGYLIKKSNLLIKADLKVKIGTTLCAFIIIFLAVTYNYIDKVPDLFYIFDEQIIKLLCGVILFSGTLWLNRFRGNISNKIRLIGRYSFWIFCIHSIEYICIPWENLTKIFGQNTYLVISVVMILRLIICGLGCYLLYAIKRRKMHV